MISPKNIIGPKSKGRNVKPRKKHIALAHNLMQSNGIMSTAMRKAGYAESVVRTPKVVVESKGFQQVMQNMGLTEELLTSCLVEDIHRKKDNRLGELTLGFKLHGKLRETQEGNKTLVLITSGESATRYNLPVKE